VSSRAKTKKPRLRMRRGLNGFEPVSDMDEQRIAMDYTFGAEVEVEVFQVRSLPRMRLYWAILHHVFHNDPYGYASPEKINDALLIAAGVSTDDMRLDGEIVKTPDSISFRKMDESAFRHYFDKALELIWVHWKIDIDALLREGDRLLTTKRQLIPHQDSESENGEEAEAA
jgi:hypothetical protein